MITAWVMVVVSLASPPRPCAACSPRAPAPMDPDRLRGRWMTGFLSWAAADDRIRVVSLLGGARSPWRSRSSSAPSAACSASVAAVGQHRDRGQQLFRRLRAAITASLTGSPWLGLIAAMIAGALVALILGLFAITYFVDQVIVGVVLNVLVVGLTNFLFRQVLTPNAESLNSPDRFSRVPIPVLGDIPLIGPIFFRQTALVYVLYIVVALVAYALYRTRWGLRVRAVGEHPKAADTVGIKVNRTRYRTILLAGAIAGMGGAYFSLVSVAGFNREMTAARATSRWPRSSSASGTRSAPPWPHCSSASRPTCRACSRRSDSPVPSQFMLMLPYLVTIFAVAGLVGRSRPPAADGVPYRQQ